MTQHIVSPAGIRLPIPQFQKKVEFTSMIQSIIKRDGRVVLYDQNKIAAAILRALEAGVGLKYAFGWENVAQLSDTSISEYGYIETDRWLSHAAEQYQQLQQFLSAVSDRTMTAHILISKDVRYSEFDNGMGVYVNYSDQDVTYGDLIIPAGGYVLQFSEEGA